MGDNGQKDTAAAESVVSPSEDEWVQLDMKLVDWSYMDFSRTVRVDTALGTLKDLLRTRHAGDVARLRVFKDGRRAPHELRRDGATLRECGIAGGARDAAPVVALQYDFTPRGCTDPDPILMC